MARGPKKVEAEAVEEVVEEVVEVVEVEGFTPPPVPEGSAVVYRDKSGRERVAGVSEGGSNLASLVALHRADEAVRVAKIAQEKAEKAADDAAREK